MASASKVKVAVLGATGYSGIETVRYLAGHPLVEMTMLTSENYAGRQVAEVYRHLAGLGNLPKLEELNPENVRRGAEVVISCLPERTGATLLADLVRGGVRVIDVSADFRLKDPESYRATYGAEHPAPDLLKKAVYGLSEFHRGELREAQIVANPGCFPTGALLALLPLIRRDLIDPSTIIVDAKSGITGGRRTASIEHLFAEINENAYAYNVGKHRHTPEMEQEIAATLGRDVAITFVPHKIPVTRGILTSVFVRPRIGTAVRDVRAALEASFHNCRFIRVLRDGETPELKNVRATNFCEISVVLDARSQILCLLTAIDNLGKGAAGQAVQNLNLMMGFDEAAGLLNLAPVP
jgi:N-acetyl-gamma-glutamyl-phosphate reductase